MKKLLVFIYLLIMILLISSSDLSLGSPGKSCTANVTVIVSLSCTLVKPDNATVTLSRHNPGNPPPVYDSVYIHVTDTTGIVHFNNLCNGIYDLSVMDFGYETTAQINITITGDMTINQTLQQIRTPPPTPPGLILNDQTLVAKWARPHFSLPILTETWDNGNFTENQWTTSGSAAGNWIVGVFGYPSSSAEFNGSPRQTSYDGYLTSKVLTGLHSPVVKLNYDIYLYNNDVGNVNTMAVELWNGASWTVLKTYTNQVGGIIWTHEHLDISSVTNSVFQIRFHAAGANSASINNWNIDNIAITAAGPGESDPCILGYNFYLNDSLTGSTTDTFYTIPPVQVTYGFGYNACVAAIYDSGLSTKTCSAFASHFLCPVTNLTATAITNAAYLMWNKPQCLEGQDMCFVYDDGTMENGIYFNPGSTDWIGNKFNISPSYTGSLKSFNLLWWNNPSATTQPFQIDVFSQAGLLIGSSQTFTVPNPSPSTFMTVTLANEIPFTGQFYGMVKWSNFNGPTHYLGMDQNGPYAGYPGVGYWYDGTTLQNCSTMGGPCALMVRACAFINGEDKLVTLGPVPAGDLPQTPATVLPGLFSLAHNPEQGISIDAHDYSITSQESPLTDIGLIGYNVYQIINGNSKFHHYVPGPDSLSSYCFNLNPGLQCFDVTAKYDLTVYGFPGTFGESLPQTPDPVCIILTCCTLPFFEPWNGGSLGYQDWTNGNNWIYNPTVGNPAPTADFTWQPVMTNYNSSLKSMSLDANAWTCGSFWLDFDYKLDDLNANGTEKMDVEVMWDNAWHRAAELENHGSVNWTSMHLDISGANGQQLSVRFRANGENTQHILNWYIDNIKIYGVCASPVALKKTQAHDTINLSWDPPQCGPIGQLMCFIFDDGTPESSWAISSGLTGWLGNLFPVPDSVTGNIHSFDLLWVSNPVATDQDFRIDVFSPAGVLLGSSQNFRVPNPPPATFMTITLRNDIPFSGSFYGMIKWSNFTGPTNFIGFDQDLPNAAQNLAYYYDGATFSHMSIAAGDGIPGIFTERVCAFTIGADKSPDSLVIIGYNVFRYDSLTSGVVNFRKLNAAAITATAYTDTVRLDTIQTGFYKYFVTALFNNSLTGTWLCESPGSDTIGVHFPLPGGVEEISGGSILVYPNPANDFVNVKSDFNISRIEVLNFLGQKVYFENYVNPKFIQINTTSLQAGVYFIKVTTLKGIHTAKITVVR